MKTKKTKIKIKHGNNKVASLRGLDFFLSWKKLEKMFSDPGPEMALEKIGNNVSRVF